MQITLKDRRLPTMKFFPEPPALCLFMLSLNSQTVVPRSILLRKVARDILIPVSVPFRKIIDEDIEPATWGRDIFIPAVTLNTVNTST